MPIVIRQSEETHTLENVSATWDNNRFDILSAPPHICTLAKAVCGFVPPNRINNKSLSHRYSVFGNDRSLLAHETNERKKILRAYIDRFVTSKLVTDFNRACEEHKSLQQDGASQAEITKKYEEAKRLGNLAKDFKEWYFSSIDGVAMLDKLGWPNENNVQRPGRATKDDFTLDVQFSDQPDSTEGTGFQISPGYVVTADHVLERPFDNTQTKGESWPYLVVYFFLHQLVGVRGLKGTKTNSHHLIQRVVMRTKSPAAGQATHDVAIIELMDDVEQPYPEQNIKLAREPVLAGESPVFLLGHPHGSPLKFISIYDGPPNLRKPSTLSPDKQGWTRTFPASISADIDVFSGNSGGPLLLDREPLEAIGVARTVDYARPVQNRIQSTFSKSVFEWLKGVFKKAKMENSELAAAAVHFYPLFESYHIGEGKVITRRQVFSNDPGMPGFILFNRVDVFWPFTNPVSAFLTDRSTAVFVSIAITIPSQRDFTLRPLLFISKKGQIAEEPVYLGQSSAIPNFEPGLSCFRWVRTLRMPSEVDDSPPETPENYGYGHIPKKALENPAGFCSWTRLDIVTPASMGAVGGVIGMITVKYGYDTSKPSETVQFINNLEFVFEQGKLTSYIGQTAIRAKNTAKVLGLRGNPWKSPEDGELDVNNDPVDAHLRSCGRSNPHQHI